MIAFEIPERSSSLFIDLVHPNAKDILVSGNMKSIKKFSTTFIKRSIEPFETIADDMLPLIVRSAIIIGKKALIILHRIFMYSLAFATNPPQILKTVTEMQRLEHRENTNVMLLLFTVFPKAFKADIKIIKERIPPKLFNTVLIPEVR